MEPMALSSGTKPEKGWLFIIAAKTSLQKFAFPRRTILMNIMCLRN